MKDWLFYTIVAVFSAVVLSLMFYPVLAQEGSPSRTDKFQPKIPPPPQLSADDIYQQLGRAHAQIELANKYVAQLQQELAAAQALCQKPEEEKK